jgi:hypothetical protein
MDYEETMERHWAHGQYYMFSGASWNRSERRLYFLVKTDYESVWGLELVPKALGLDSGTCENLSWKSSEFWAMYT